MLTPSYLSRKLKTPTHVGIFFHTPFPSSDVFRILPCSLSPGNHTQGATPSCTRCCR